MRSVALALAALTAALGLASCASLGMDAPRQLAQTRRVADYPTYSLRRVGLLPFGGDMLDGRRESEFRDAFLFEFSRHAPYEVVVLDAAKIAEVDPTRPYERGEYSSRTVLELARRFRLDGLLVGDVTQFEVYSPQLLGVQLDLVAAETGLVIWSSSVHIDAGDATLTPNFERFRSLQRDDPAGWADLQITLLSPSRLARFAAYEMALTL